MYFFIYHDLTDYSISPTHPRCLQIAFLRKLLERLHMHDVFGTAYSVSLRARHFTSSSVICKQSLIHLYLLQVILDCFERPRGAAPHWCHALRFRILHADPLRLLFSHSTFRSQRALEHGMCVEVLHGSVRIKAGL